MSWLCVDAGNTRIKWAHWDGAHWQRRGVVETKTIRDHGIASLLAYASASEITRMLVSNVAGAAVGKQLLAWADTLGCRADIIVPRAFACGVRNGYAEPSQLGTDRWAALIAAHAAARFAPRAQLVVMAGTALTVDALTEDGHFLGGVIVPGIQLMRASLHASTAQLPRADGSYDTFPKDSVTAISSGAIEAACGAIERVYAHLAARESAENAPHCIGGGGALATLSPHLPFPVTINENLVLDGLVALAKEAT